MHKPLFHRLLSDDIETEEVDPRTVTNGLLSPEVEAISSAAQTRVEQFTAGRVCSRVALGRFGVAATTPILRGEDRAPIWPKGFVGTITHTDPWCSAAVARSESFRSVGIDLEPATPLKEALWRRVCTKAEREHLRDAPDPGLRGKLMFSAKEAVYKWLARDEGRVVGFQEVELGFSLARGSFATTLGFESDLPTPEGRWRLGPEFLVTAVW